MRKYLYLAMAVLFIAACGDEINKKVGPRNNVDPNNTNNTNDLGVNNTADVGVDMQPEDMGSPEDMAPPEDMSTTPDEGSTEEMGVDMSDPNADSDNDNILDSDEGRSDADGDQTPNYLDIDSDGDGIEDIDEAGDAFLDTPPVDSDGDGTPDYLDTDSDDDGLSDAEELAAGTFPTVSDSDGDGSGDLVEVTLGTDPNNQNVSPASRGLTGVVLQPGATAQARVAFRPRLQHLDVYLSADGSGSMFDEHDRIDNGWAGLANTLTCTPSGTACEADQQCTSGFCGSDGQCYTEPANDTCFVTLFSGAGEWVDLDSFTNLVSLQSDPLVTAAPFDNLVGGGASETPIQPPACAVDGTQCNNPNIGCSSVGNTCVGFRSDAERLYVQITDANDQCDDMMTGRCNLFTAMSVGIQLRQKLVAFGGLIGNEDTGGVGVPIDIARSIGLASNTVDVTGQAFVYANQGSQTMPNLRRLLNDFATTRPVDAQIELVEKSGDDGDIGAAIDRFETDTSAGCDAGGGTLDVNNDGFPDTHIDVLPGSNTCWNVVLDGSAITSTSSVQVFEATLEVSSRASKLDARPLVVIIPATP